MDFTGLINRFPVNRPLTEQERAHQLHQKRRLDLKPRYQLAVIKMNSTYLESVDKWFAWKGMVSAFAIAIFLIFIPAMCWMAGSWFLESAGVLPSAEGAGFLFANGFAMAAFAALIAWFCVWFLRKESFRYTYYPIRFNRKNRTVYVWRTDGSVLTVPWDEVFFTLAWLRGEWEVRGHVLADDGSTVLESFALSYRDIPGSRDLDPAATQFSDGDFLRSQWEFVRRYMEEGPAAVSG